MNIYITKIIYRDELNEKGKLVDSVAQAMRENFQDKSFGISIDTVWFYLVFQPLDYYPDGRREKTGCTFRRKMKELAISAEIIDYDTFIKADQQTCLNLIARTLLETIPKTKNKVKDFPLEAFKQDCYHLFLHQQWIEK